MIAFRSAAIVLALFFATSSVAFAADDLKKRYSDKELIRVLKKAGYQSVQKEDKRVIKISIDGLNYYLYIYEDDDLQLYFGLTGHTIDLAAINEWNKTKRLTRAYLDDDSDPVLESDLLANAGYSTRQLIEWVQVFDTSVRGFRRHIEQNDSGG